VLTDHVFSDPSALRYSLSLCAVLGMTATIAVLGVGRRAYRETVATRPSRD
jgi:hypothetical protein